MELKKREIRKLKKKHFLGKFIRFILIFYLGPFGSANWKYVNLKKKTQIVILKVKCILKLRENIGEKIECDYFMRERKKELCCK